jgi:hypothetical protein
MSEPVVFWDGKNQFEIGNLTVKSYGNDSTWIPLYTHPMRELTDEEIKQIFTDKTGYEVDTCPSAILDFSRAILKKANEK